MTVKLAIQAASTIVNVTEVPTLLDAHRTGVVYSVGAQQVKEQQSSIPARGVLDLVNMEPGWIFEANGVLHPRGSEYQTLSSSMAYRWMRIVRQPLRRSLTEAMFNQ